ncbi:MAG TPA: response regulator [Polyangiaceae bacterium]|nr:response regulator [Polyangiaceae bacterium]
MTASATNPTVLLVDDSEIACEAVKHALATAGVSVVTLNSPFGFIRATREARPSLILLDVGLGTVNGTKLVELGRQHAPPGCPILLYSSRAAAQLQEDARASGADGFISKSTTGPALVSAVRHWLTEKRRTKPFIPE